MTDERPKTPGAPLDAAAPNSPAIDTAKRDSAKLDGANPAAKTAGPESGQWLHPSSLVFEFAAGIRSQLIPAVLALFSATTGSWVGGLIALLFFAVSMVTMVLRYIGLRYRLAGDELIIDEGILYRVHRTVPVHRIQNIDLVQNPFHRLLGVAEVRVETASGTEPEAVLRVLKLTEVDSLRARIFARKQDYELSQTVPPRREQSEHVAPGALLATTGRVELPELQPALERVRSQSIAGEANARETQFKLTWKQLALAGIASDRGTVLLLVGLGLVWQQSSSSFRPWRVSIEDVTPYLSERADSLNWMWVAIGGVLGLAFLLLLVKGLSIAWYVLKFYDYTLDRSGEDLRVSCGLLTRVSATVRRDRIQLISIHRTQVGRWLGIASIRIETAGGGGGDEDDPSSTIARRWFMPVISEAQIPAVIAQLSPGLQWDEQAFDWQPLAKNAARRMRRFTILAAGLLAVVTGALGSLVGVGTALLLGALGWWWSARQATATRYARSAGKIIFRSGVFTSKCSLTFVDKVQAVTVVHSPLDRRWNMARLSVDTIASGPAEHRIAIPMLDIAVARSERDSICQAASLTG